MDEDVLPASMHPYAQAYTSLRGRETGERDDLAGQVRELSMSMAAAGSLPSTAHSSTHARAQSQAAPNYDRHSFADRSPPVPALPPLPTPGAQSAAGSSGGMRSPQGGAGRRVLTVVNGDAHSLPAEDPGRVLPTDRRIRQPRLSYADSVYEMPPPAYDAIDFSVPPVPPLPRPHPLPQARQGTPQLPLTPLHSALMAPTPLPMPPVEAGGEGMRGS